MQIQPWKYRIGFSPVLRCSFPTCCPPVYHSATLQGEYTCLCLATCYSVYEADESEGAVSGSLCRDLPCPTTCSNAPASNMVYLGNPANVVYQGFAWAPMNATNGTAWSNFTMISPNGTFPANYTGNSTAGNSTVAAAFGMSFEECRSHAAAQINPPTPYFSHLEGPCLYP